MGPQPDIPPRLCGYPRVRGRPSGLEVREARGLRARLVGLAGLDALPPRLGLLLPATRSAHTLGMRFCVDLVWLDGTGRVVHIDRRVPPARLRSCRRAAALLELAGGQADETGLEVDERLVETGPHPRSPQGRQ
ncbi:MAG TPA: DUF192 domain-containing protein [Solirubrobacteraceae bacterium]|nr:DUF192 domain-containing protein [Solirubrobacteraceae bacterium]